MSEAAAPSPTAPEPPAPATPLPERPFRRSLRWFMAEFLVVAAGILVAMALNAWYQDRVDARNEREYLTLLGRDVAALAQHLDENTAFEDLQTQDGLLLYRALSAPTLPKDVLPLSIAMTHLGTRRTLMLESSTYDDLVNTGNFHLIRNAALRDRIAAFYQDTGLRLEVINKNNAFFVDEGFNARILQSGLIQWRASSNVAPVRAVEDRLSAQLAGGYIDRPVDRLWTLPADAPEWSMVRSNIVSRLRVSRLSAYYSGERAEAARKLKSALDAELAL